MTEKPKKDALDHILTAASIVLILVFIFLSIKTIFEPRTVQIVIGEDDVIGAIETGGGR